MFFTVRHSRLTPKTNKLGAPCDKLAYICFNYLLKNAFKIHWVCETYSYKSTVHGDAICQSLNIFYVKLDTPYLKKLNFMKMASVGLIINKVLSIILKGHYVSKNRLDTMMLWVHVFIFFTIKTPRAITALALFGV